MFHDESERRPELRSATELQLEEVKLARLVSERENKHCVRKRTTTSLLRWLSRLLRPPWKRLLNTYIDFKKLVREDARGSRRL